MAQSRTLILTEPAVVLIVYREQRAEGLSVWNEPFVQLNPPRLFDVVADPFERAHEVSGSYDRWYVEHLLVLAPAIDIVTLFQSTFVEFPPREGEGTVTAQQRLGQLQQVIQQSSRLDREQRGTHREQARGARSAGLMVPVDTVRRPGEVVNLPWWSP